MNRGFSSDNKDYTKKVSGIMLSLSLEWQINRSSDCPRGCAFECRKGGRRRKRARKSLERRIELTNSRVVSFRPYLLPTSLSLSLASPSLLTLFYRVALELTACISLSSPQPIRLHSLYLFPLASLF